MTEKLLKMCLKHSNTSRMCHIFVPKHQKVCIDNVLVLQDFVSKHKRILVITGAGISTESGLPDYRSEIVGLYSRSSKRPILYKDFITKSQARKNYWARNFLAWNTFSSAQPNNTHFCLTNWEKKGILNYIITQNVDRLHQKAGSEHVIELHGSSYMVKCLTCGDHFSRYILQKELTEINPNFQATCGEIRPDADIELDPSFVETFNVLNCQKCGGLLKPDVIFFGETVPKEKVYDVHSKLLDSDAMLVVGSSLQVYSAYRFVLAASEQGKSIGIVNIGPTRADSLASFKLSNRCGELLPMVNL